MRIEKNCSDVTKKENNDICTLLFIHLIEIFLSKPNSENFYTKKNHLFVFIITASDVTLISNLHHSSFGLSPALLDLLLVFESCWVSSSSSE